jgi:hypothetical protein
MNISSASTSVCVNGSIAFSSTHTNGGVVPNYQWSMDGGLNWTTPSTSSTFSPVFNTVGTFQVMARIISTASCASSLPVQSTNTITVTVNQNPVVSLSAFSSVCQSNTPITLSGGSPTGGTYSGSNVSLNSFTPSTVGSTSITYTYTDVNGCSNSANSSINVNSNPTVTLSSFSNVCQSNTPIALSGGSPTGGNYSGTNVSSNSFTPSTVGATLITYNYTDANGCSSSSSSNINVIANPSVTLAVFNPVCQSNTPVALSGGLPAGGVYSGTNVSSNSFTPSTVGATTITYTVTVSGCTSSSNSSITVNAPPTVTLAAFSNVCQSNNAISLSGGAPAGGTYSGTNVNSGLGTFTPSTSGTTTITYTYSSGGCTRSATNSITVLPTVLPAVSLTSNPTSPICEGTLVQFAVSNPQNQGAAPQYSWSTDNGVTWTSPSSATTYQYNFTTVGTFQVLVRLTSNATCASPQTITSLPYTMDVTPFTKAGFDLVIKDNDLPDDAGLEPNPDNGPMWESDYIWTRQTPFPANGVQEDPEYSITNPNYVFVQIWNRGCSDYDGTSADLHLYWAKASTGLLWPDSWDGTAFDPCLGNGVPISDELPMQTIPAIHRKQFISTPMMFNWHVPDPALYQTCFPLDYEHFCLLGRIVSAQDPIGVEVQHQYTNTQNYNNVAWKNLSVVDVVPGNFNSEDCYSDRQVGGMVAIGNPYEIDDVYDFIFKTDDNYSGKPISKQAEIKITLDEPSWNKWLAGGSKCTNLKIKREDCRQLVVTGNPAKLENLAFPKEEHNIIGVSFNFLTNEVDGTPQFDYHVIQVRNEDNRTIIGGELYRIGKPTRYLFNANGGGNKNASLHESVNLVANTIGEDAYYNWYDQGGNLVYSGTNFTVSPEFTTKYKLEVIAKSDGFTSYDSVLVHIKEYEIINLNPNPTAGQLTVDYEARKATSGYLSIVQPYTSVSNNYMIDVNQTSTTLNLSGYIPGTYFIRLICDGQIRDEKTIVIIQ